MHIHAFSSLCNFAEGLGMDSTFGSVYVDATERVRAFINKLHPKQFISSHVEIPM